ncbi:MAG: DUF4294 domain-containing protein [Bacteroidetes bacterium]|nr:DUF4294 domain-containing protein [Bacteroidota bacterium]
MAGIVIMLSSVSLIAQETESNSNESKGRIIVRAVIQGNDTIPFIYLKPYRVIGRRKFKTRRAQVKYYKLVRDVKKAYPYARLAASLLQQYNKELDSLNSEKDQKNYLKEIEKKLKKEFMSELKNLTVTQGRILLKLVDRETGNTSYVLLKELRSSFSAIFWQTLARLFGNNLKSTYNPYGADKKIEDIVRMIEEDAAENLN